MPADRSILTQRRRSGFTLVEMLVAMAIFAMLAAAGSALLAAAVDAGAAANARSARASDFQRTRALLRDDLGQAMPRRPRESDGSPSPNAFAGSSASGTPLLRVVRSGWANVGDAPRPSLRLVEYWLVDGRLERRFFARIDGARPEPVQILLTGVSDARVAFVSRGNETAAWLGDPTRPLPDAVRLDLELDGYGEITQWFLVGSGRS
jgi:general secretion pathway protein J